MILTSARRFGITSSRNGVTSRGGLAGGKLRGEEFLGSRTAASLSLPFPKIGSGVCRLCVRITPLNQLEQQRETYQWWIQSLVNTIRMISGNSLQRERGIGRQPSENRLVEKISNFQPRNLPVNHLGKRITLTSTWKNCDRNFPNMSRKDLVGDGCLWTDSLSR